MSSRTICAPVRLRRTFCVEANVPVTELRAGIIVGAGSAAFEVMRDMVYNLPVLTPPRWVRSRTTPIALENLAALSGGAVRPSSQRNRIFEAAGPEGAQLSANSLKHFMAVSGKRRWLIPIPLPTRWISVWFFNVITSVPAHHRQGVDSGAETRFAGG